MLRVFRMARWGVLPLLAGERQELSLIHAEDLAAALVSAAGPAAGGRVYYAAHPRVVTARQLLEAVHDAVRRARGRGPARPTVLRVPPGATRAALWITGTAARALGRRTLLSPDKGKELLATAWTCSAAALERDTGWRAAVDLPEGLARTADWYRTRGWL